jgi:hypothetical protein
MAQDTAAKLIKQLQHIETSLADLVRNATPDKFTKKGEGGWSAADYLKHILLSIKPVVKAGEMSKDILLKSFGASGRASQPYEAVVAKYDKRLKEGVRAEDAPAVTPSTYRIPAGTSDERAFLLKEWADTHKRLYKILEKMKSVDLDMVQLPHPAIGLITLREMIYFTVYHNTLHWHDIEALVS